MSEANKKARRPAGYKPFWESDEEPVEQPKPSYDWSNLKSRVLGDKLAADVAEEETKKLKERYGR